MREKVEKRIRKDYPNGIPAIGTDALRFTFAALASYSRTINFDIKRAEGYKAFCNKLWNAARFVLMNLPEGELPAPSGAPVTEAERWILTRLKQTLSEVEQHFATYRFDLLAQSLYEFSWNEYLRLVPGAVQAGVEWRRRRSCGIHPPYLAGGAGNGAARTASDHAIHHRGNLAVGGAETRHQGRRQPMQRSWPNARRSRCR